MYPHYCTTADDRERMDVCCGRDLAKWRAIRQHHHALPNVNAKLNHRTTLEAAYNHLRDAFGMACPSSAWAA